MRFRLFPLMAAMLAAAGAGGAQAQDAGGSLLRGSVDDGGSQLLLTNVPVPEPAPVPALRDRRYRGHRPGRPANADDAGAAGGKGPRARYR